MEFGLVVRAQQAALAANDATLARQLAQEARSAMREAYPHVLASIDHYKSLDLQFIYPSTWLGSQHSMFLLKQLVSGAGPVTP